MIPVENFKNFPIDIEIVPMLSTKGKQVVKVKVFAATITFVVMRISIGADVTGKNFPYPQRHITGFTGWRQWIFLAAKSDNS
jgi:hypothetical protein